MSTWEIRTVTTREEFDAVVDCQWAGFAKQDQFWDIWFPVDKNAHLAGQQQQSGAPAPAPAPDPDAAFRDSADRLWREHRDDPASTWIYIADPERPAGGRAGAPYVLGSCQWRVYESDPFAAGVPEIHCPAWPRGSDPDVVCDWLTGLLFTPRLNWMARPHVGLSWIAVRPSHRRRGIGGALMSWGNAAADRLGLESYVEGTDAGRALYTRHGYRVIEEVRGAVPGIDASPGRRAVARAYDLEDGFHYTTLWRPKNGVWTQECDDIWRERLAKFSNKKAPTAKVVASEVKV